MAKPGAEECSEEGGGMSAFGFLSFVLAVVNGKLDRKPHSVINKKNINIGEWGHNPTTPSYYQYFSLISYRSVPFIFNFKIFCQAYPQKSCDQHSEQHQHQHQQ